MDRQKPKLIEDLILGGVLFAIYLGLGAYFCLVRHWLPGDSLARVINAYLVFYGAEIKLATIGFIWPPIPTLVLLPFVWSKYLVFSWLAAVIPSAFFMALASIFLNRIAQDCLIARPWRLLLIFLFAANPMIVLFAANGMSEAILIAIIMGACFWMVRFWKSNRNLDMILSAAFFGFLPLIRYEMVVMTLGGGLLLLLHTWTRYQHDRVEEFTSRLEGRMLAYSALAVYPLFLWIVASWQIMGNPLYFLLNDRSALTSFGGQAIFSRAVPNALLLSFQMWYGPFPVGLIVTLLAVYIGLRKKSSFLISLTIFFNLLPIFEGLLISQTDVFPLMRYFILTYPLAIVLLVSIWSLIAPANRNSAAAVRYQASFFLASVVLMGASSFATIYTLNNWLDFQSIEQGSWNALVTDKPVYDESVGEAINVGRTLARVIPNNSRVLIDTFDRGFAVYYGAQDPSMFLDHTSRDFNNALLRPQDYVDFVLIPSLADKGAYNMINSAHPSLYEEGAPWAEQVDWLPVTQANYRLYKIIH